MIVNDVSYTNNVIKNIINVGNGCGNDKITCVDGYSLYFPCLKNITKGQNVCFDFYVGDNTYQEELDLSNIDSLTLSLSGLFGCEYSSYVYPDDIISLQTKTYEKIIYDDFEIKHICNLSLLSLDTDLNEINPNITGVIGNFYIGEHVTLMADDTPTHIFLGWCKYDESIFDNECIYNNIESIILSDSKNLDIDMFDDENIIALYRKRKEYKIVINNNNKNSYFKIDDNYLYTEKDYIRILEGYGFVATCIPITYEFDGEIKEYSFVEWMMNNDDKIYSSIEMIANDKNDFLNGDKIELLCKCEDIDIPNISNTVEIKYSNEFGYNSPEENIIEDKLIIGDFYFDNNNIIEQNNNTFNAYNLDNSYLCIHNGYIDINNVYDDKIRIEISVNGLEESVIYFETENQSIPYNIEEGIDDVIGCLLKKSESPIKIRVEGKILINDLSIYVENIENKGLMRLCLSTEDTSKFITGDLYITGAIEVEGNIFGLSKQIIGKINNLKSIIYDNNK